MCAAADGTQRGSRTPAAKVRLNYFSRPTPDLPRGRYEVQRSASRGKTPASRGKTRERSSKSWTGRPGTVCIAINVEKPDVPVWTLVESDCDHSIPMAAPKIEMAPISEIFK